MKKLALLALLLPKILFAQFQIINKVPDSNNYFPIQNPEYTTSIYYDANDYKVVKKVSNLFANDIKLITDKQPHLLSTDEELEDYIIIIGSIGNNRIIDQLIADKKLNVSPIINQWERYTIQTINKPFKGVKKALVIAGSDRRGTAYGVFSLSEAIGVSPWYYWADVPVKKNNEIYIKDLSYISKAPSVKYRGVFLNDEDWGLKPWASKLIDPEINDIGPKTYAKVFELALRLKGNMVAPAMHECTGAFFKYPENKIVADTFAIMMTSSHAEPLLYNNTTEWHQLINGNWDYIENKKGVLSALDKRVAEAAPFENIYTVGMRGIHDTGMNDVPEGYTKSNVLEQVIDEERNILTKYIKKPENEIPQIFVPYKEVLDIYESGMKLPEDITIVWPDDNYGYIKKLSNSEEQKRKGGSGVYYHISYLGWPNDYLWLNTTPPALMYAEMKKAYDLGANKYWLLNVGDIKPGEMGMQLFLDMAWDFDAFNFENINHYQVNKLTSVFGEKNKQDIAYILDRYYYHGFTRKPEYMSWDWAWNSIFLHPDIKDTDFSFVNYNEAENRLNEYKDIANKAENILEKLPEELKPSFFELLYYPVKGASLYNHKMLVAQKNRWYAAQGRAITNSLANDAKLYQDSIAQITLKYNNLLGGKWDGMMTAPGFLPTPHLAPTKQIELPNVSEMGLFVEGCTDTIKKYKLLQFNKHFNDSHFFEVYNKGSLTLNWKATVSQDWIKLDKSEGTTKTQQRIKVSVDWDKFPTNNEGEGEIVVLDGKTSQKIQVSAIKPIDIPKNHFVANNGVISINPTEYQRKNENGNIKFTLINGLGYSNSSLQLGNAKYDSGEDSYVSYDFYTTHTGEVIIHTYMLPLFAKDREHGTSYGVQIDDGEIIIKSNDVKEYSREWASNVVRNTTINKTKISIESSGKHTLKIYSVDPGMIIQKIIIDLGGLKESYIGPKPMKN
ncbi:glycosyl hydrolase 115 family protein [Confluentibacter lentus]|uniref:glycosyl hydrolase 115 family protein n=1 Tax=Confluentibacter lentus TaxID=1699412 RepID=UPI000C2876C0|nr:glycosyl hydrolase 115 family protein [Confluentibacter lentus]